MKRLSGQGHWDQVHESDSLTPYAPAGRSARDRLIARIFGRKVLQYSQSYYLWLYFDVLLKRYLPEAPGATIVEIGSAPGKFLVWFRDRFGYDPYGIEYSEQGVQLNREVFAANGIAADHVIQADIMADELHRQYREKFDIVFSHSFLEHFAEPEDMVARHLNLLKPGGHLVIWIPNLRGFNKLLFRFFSPGGLSRHNLDLMRKRRFSACFDRRKVEPLYCNHMGTLNLGLFNTPPGSWKRHLLRLGTIIQRPLNVVLRALFRERGREGRYWSPGLLFIGRKL